MLFDISSSAIRGAEVVEWVGGKCLENEETNTIANMEFFKKYNFHVNDHNFQWIWNEGMKGKPKSHRLDLKLLSKIESF